MSLTTAQTAELLKKYGRHERDTGSPESQVALLTARLNYLNDHFKSNSKDHHSRTGLMKLVGQRRRLLDYLHKTNAEAYRKLITDLGIRK
ncbi:30S ribosomal protein S15 [Planctomyces bekefii]|uniref:Small ribosomal subunit protein uS15 n=1 Tax=Planctomyces bekefii TaxID=1653850 RepID=A0A5C6M933_9PLAN|nr:30S ribosomal protein S15 [Planctomyces bekefii]